MFGMAACNWPASIRTAICRSPIELAFLRDEAVYPHINRADYAHTLYPPAAQAIFALAAVVTPGVFGMKVMMAAFDALAIVALIVLLRIAGRDPAELLIYAWLPLPVWEFAGNAHIDGAVAGPAGTGVAARGARAVDLDRRRAGRRDADEVPARGGAAGLLAAAGLAVAGRLRRRRWSASTCRMSSIGWQVLAFFPAMPPRRDFRTATVSSCWNFSAASCRCLPGQPGFTSRLCLPCWHSWACASRSQVNFRRPQARV